MPTTKKEPANMGAEEAKGQFLEAEQLYAAGRHAEALALLEGLRRTLPGSRRVTYQQALCLMALGRYDEALACCDDLEGKLEAAHVEVLRSRITREQRAAVKTPVPPTDPGQHTLQTPQPYTGFTPTPAPISVPKIPPVALATPIPLPDNDTDPELEAPPQKPVGMTGSPRNIFQIDSVFPLSTQETTVMGRVSSGAFYTGDMVSVLSPSGPPMFAPIVRIGPVETPVRVARQGQQTMMVLRIEPQFVAVGARLTSSGASEAYAETIVAMAADEGPAASGESSASADPALDAAHKLLDERRFLDARAHLENYLGENTESWTAYRLLARLHLEADDELRDVDKALSHVQRAYELGGDRDADVLETLAKALGAAGRAEQGIRYLEQIHALASGDEDRKAAARKISAYRNRFRLGNVWEFMNGWGDVVFESGKVDEITKALTNGSIPKDAKCRLNHFGDWRTIPEALVPQHPELAVFYAPPKKSGVWRGAIAGLLAGLLAGIGGGWIPGVAGNPARMAGVGLGATLLGLVLGVAVSSLIGGDATSPRSNGKR